MCIQGMNRGADAGNLVFVLRQWCGGNMEFQLKERYRFDDLLALMVLLRSENGCPWDRAQTHASVRVNLLEEAYEAAEALDEDDPVHLCEELGDVLLQVVFHARMEEEAHRFSMQDVVDMLCKKLVERHPHVFGDRNAASPEQALQGWDEAKRRARGQQTQAEAMEGVSHALPAAMRSAKVWNKAVKAASPSPDVSALLSEARRGLDRLGPVLEASDGDAAAQALGKALFALCALASSAGVEPEQALARACDGYVRAFAKQEQMADGNAALAALREERPVL